MNKFTRALVLGLATSAFALAGCATTSNSKDACADCNDPANCEKCSGDAAATTGAANDACPFSGEDINASIQTVSFQGQEIGFCCGGCAGKFAKMSDAEKTTLLDG